MSGPAAAGGRPPLSGRQRWQIAGFSAAALLIWLGLRFLGGPPPLSPMDFVAGGADALQFCDPNHPQFLPVVARSSPVSLSYAPGRPSRVILMTASGKPIGPDQLAPTDGARLWLFLVDRNLTQFQARRPVPGAAPGEWVFDDASSGPGPFRVFADLTPAATGRELYARAASDGSEAATQSPPADGVWRIELHSAPAQTYARQLLALTLSIRRADGAPFILGTTGGARAHLVAFDQGASGLVNLRSVEPAGMADGHASGEAHFAVTFPDSGAYVLWAELTLNGQTMIRRFALNVLP